MPLRQRVNRYNESAETITDWSTAEATTFLRSEGVTHIYIGPKDGDLKPHQLNNNPDTTLIYSHGGVYIFELHPSTLTR